MSANVEAKKLVVEEIKNKISNAKSVVLISMMQLFLMQDAENAIIHHLSVIR